MILFMYLIMYANCLNLVLQTLEEYRRELANIDGEHRALQAELAECRHRFEAERKNYFLLTAVPYTILICILVAAILFWWEASQLRSLFGFLSHREPYGPANQAYGPANQPYGPANEHQ